MILNKSLKYKKKEILFTSIESYNYFKIRLKLSIYNSSLKTSLIKWLTIRISKTFFLSSLCVQKNFHFFCAVGKYLKAQQTLAYLHVSTASSQVCLLFHLDAALILANSRYVSLVCRFNGPEHCALHTQWLCKSKYFVRFTLYRATRNQSKRPFLVV